MMFRSKSKKDEAIKLEEEILKLKAQKTELEKIIQSLKEEQTTAMTTAVENFQFSLDFNSMNAFSIERVIRNDQPKTVVGYFIGGNVKEWYLETSAKEHNRIVAEFELWKGQKK